jgi:hypothetical protein
LTKPAPRDALLNTRSAGAILRASLIVSAGVGACRFLRFPYDPLDGPTVRIPADADENRLKSPKEVGGSD